MTLRLETFRERVERAASARNGEPIYNGSLEHAAVIVEMMFGNAHKNVDILTGRLNARIYARDRVVEQARLFLVDHSHKVRILIEEDVGDDELMNHPFLAGRTGARNVEVHRLDAGMRDGVPFHLLVMDGDSYRFEQDKRVHEAVAAFGNETVAANLQHIFDTVWAHSTPVKFSRS